MNIRPGLWLHLPGENLSLIHAATLIDQLEIINLCSRAQEVFLGLQT